MVEGMAEYFSFGAVQIVVMTAKKRVVFKFRNSIIRYREVQESLIERLDQIWRDFGPDYDFIMDYTDFEPPQDADPDEEATFYSLLSAIRAVGVPRYYRVVPAHLDEFATLVLTAATAAGIESINVHTIEEAHARLDAENAA